MKKNYIIGVILGLMAVLFLGWFIVWSDKTKEKEIKSSMPKIGQKLWTYNMNKYQWREYNASDDDNSKEEIILQAQEPVGNGGYTSYHLLSGNAQVPKEDVWVGEGSEEFLKGKKLYSYYPKNFEFYEVIFNGVKFVPRKLSENEIKDVINGYEIIRVSQLKKSPVTIKYSKFKNKYLILNDTGDNFYKYYIIPNDSKKMELGRFSNQFKIMNKVDIKIQRLEGCSKAYPCYEINVE